MNILTRRASRSNTPTSPTLQRLDDRVKSVSESRKYAKSGESLTKWQFRLTLAKGEFISTFFLFEFINLLSGGRINSKQSSLSDKPSRDSVTDTSDPSYFIGDSKTGLQPAPTDMSPPSITPGTLRAVRQRPREIDHWCDMPRPMIGSSRQTTRVIRTSTKSSRQQRQAGHRGNIDAIRSR